jgi:hypothetical protein
LTQQIKHSECLIHTAGSCSGLTSCKCGAAAAISLLLLPPLCCFCRLTVTFPASSKALLQAHAEPILQANANGSATASFLQANAEAFLQA